MQELRGKPVADVLVEKCSSLIDSLKTKGIIPKLTIVRVGEREDDLSYEKGVIKRFSAAGAIAEVAALPADCSQKELDETICKLNDDSSVHGILMFRPLPVHLSENNIKRIISESKDVDCMGLNNLAYLFAGGKNGYPPCTPQAVIELLEHYKIDLTGKKVIIVGRSLVVGKPLAMQFLAKNATVTVCHTKTINLADECKKADILIACAGVARMITEKFFNQGQIVIDVGINMEYGKLVGDVDYEPAVGTVKAITPVPGGVGAITTAVLLKHTVQSAEKAGQSAAREVL